MEIIVIGGNRLTKYANYTRSKRTSKMLYQMLDRIMVSLIKHKYLSAKCLCITGLRSININISSIILPLSTFLVSSSLPAWSPFPPRGFPPPFTVFLLFSTCSFRLLHLFVSLSLRCITHAFDIPFSPFVTYLFTPSPLFPLPLKHRPNLIEFMTWTFSH